MNERCNSCFSPKRKTGLHITGARINANHVRVSPYLGRGKDHETSPLQRSRGRGCNVQGHSGLRTMSYKENVDRSSPQREKEVCLRAPGSTDPASKSDSVNEKPSTFVCEGIEVDFDSSDSEEEVRALKVVKVLKKTSNTNDCAVHICPTEYDSPRPKINPWVHGKVLHKHDLPNKNQSGGDGQVPIRVTPAAVVIPQTSVRPSYVILSGLRKRTSPNQTGLSSNCAIIKRPRFLFSQQVRPSTNRSTNPLLPFPRFQDNAHLSSNKDSDLNLQELRIIEDVLDMMEEVETRARYLIV